MALEDCSNCNLSSFRELTLPQFVRRNTLGVSAGAFKHSPRINQPQRESFEFDQPPSRVAEYGTFVFQSLTLKTSRSFTSGFSTCFRSLTISCFTHIGKPCSQIQGKRDSHIHLIIATTMQSATN